MFIFVGLGIGFLIAFIKDKGGNNYIWAILIFLAVLSVIYIVIDERKSKKELTRKKSQYLDLGKLLFENYTTEFEVFYQSYLQTNNKNLKPIEAIHEFADKKGLSLIIDCKGEENEGEVEYFISSLIDKTISWTNTAKLRERNSDYENNNSKFIYILFNAIDKDLKEINGKLLFFDLGTDSYIFTVTQSTIFKKITKIENEDFHGSEKFKT